MKAAASAVAAALLSLVLAITSGQPAGAAGKPGKRHTRGAAFA
jgi:hypothetical protein